MPNWSYTGGGEGDRSLSGGRSTTPLSSLRFTSLSYREGQMCKGQLWCRRRGRRQAAAAAGGGGGRRQALTARCISITSGSPPGALPVRVGGRTISTPLLSTTRSGKMASAMLSPTASALAAAGSASLHRDLRLRVGLSCSSPGPAAAVAAAGGSSREAGPWIGPQTCRPMSLGASNRYTSRIHLEHHFSVSRGTVSPPPPAAEEHRARAAYTLWSCCLRKIDQLE